MRRLIVGFRGKHNAACILVTALTGEPILLTNSFEGLRKDIVKMSDADEVVMFGIDTRLRDAVRIEKSADTIL